MVFPTHIVLAGAGDVSAAPPSGIVEVLKSLLMNTVANPINAIANANYIGILAWALVLGAALRNHGSDVTRQVVADLAEAVSTVVKWIIRFAPLGIFGLVSSTIAGDGFRRAGGLCEAACGAVGLYGVYRASGQSRHRVVENPPQSLSAGVYLPARKRRVCLLYPFFRRQYPREYGFGEKLGLHEDTYSISIRWGRPSIWAARRLRLPFWLWRRRTPKAYRLILPPRCC